MQGECDPQAAMSLADASTPRPEGGSRCIGSRQPTCPVGLPHAELGGCPWRLVSTREWDADLLGGRPPYGPREREEENEGEAGGPPEAARGEEAALAGEHAGTKR